MGRGWRGAAARATLNFPNIPSHITLSTGMTHELERIWKEAVFA
jgi:hypothetical protein